VRLEGFSKLKKIQLTLLGFKLTTFIEVWEPLLYEPDCDEKQSRGPNTGG
jgi:hypothetical protein